MPSKPRSRLDPSGRPRGCVQLDRHIPAYRQYLADRGNAAGYARSCEEAVAHLSLWMKGAKQSLTDVDEGLVAEFVDTHLPSCHCATSGAPTLPGRRRPDEVPAQPVTMQRTAVAGNTRRHSWRLYSAPRSYA